ncbi:hypothetical protein Rs2_02896 [Raphanus sativus]|nr:hypothetical protein Rs2_02896 [Raphanus sativus]
MIAFKKATYAISERRDSSSRNASGDGTTTAGNKRWMIRRSDDTSPSQSGRHREGVSTWSQRPSLTGYSSGGVSGVLADLNENVFARMQALPLDKDPSGSLSFASPEGPNNGGRFVYEPRQDFGTVPTVIRGEE